MWLKFLRILSDSDLDRKIGNLEKMRTSVSL